MKMEQTECSEMLAFNTFLLALKSPVRVYFKGTEKNLKSTVFLVIKI
jgi:hypothetical protein